MSSCLTEAALTMRHATGQVPAHSRCRCPAEMMKQIRPGNSSWRVTFWLRRHLTGLRVAGKIHDHCITADFSKGICLSARRVNPAENCP
jgi:hypothetical protein